MTSGIKGQLNRTQNLNGNLSSKKKLSMSLSAVATDPRSVKTVLLSDDGRRLLFYREPEPIEESYTPIYVIELPFVKRTPLFEEGNVIVFNANGDVKDGEIALSDLVTQEYLDGLFQIASESDIRALFD